VEGCSEREKNIATNLIVWRKEGLRSYESQLINFAINRFLHGRGRPSGFAPFSETLLSQHMVHGDRLIYRGLPADEMVGRNEKSTPKILAILWESINARDELNPACIFTSHQIVLEIDGIYSRCSERY